MSSVKKVSNSRSTDSKVKVNSKPALSSGQKQQVSLTTTTLAQSALHESSIGQYRFLHRASDNYINLTRMLRQVDKNVNDYLDLKSTKAYIEYVSAQVKIPVDQLVYVVKGRTGTWAHPLIATHAAQWASHEMSYAVAQLVDRFTQADSRLALDVVMRTQDDLDSSVGQAIAEQAMDKMSTTTQERVLARQTSKKTNSSLNKALAAAQTSRKVYGAVQNAITLGLYGAKVKELKAELGIPYQVPLRDSLDTDQLVEMAFVELTARRSIERDSTIKGDNACVDVTSRSAEIVKQLSTTNNLALSISVNPLLTLPPRHIDVPVCAIQELEEQVGQEGAEMLPHDLLPASV